MAYFIPTLYVIVSYTFFLLPGLFDHVMELKILSILLPFIMGVVNLITVLTVGRKWTRKTLLNCTLIIKYGFFFFFFSILFDWRKHYDRRNGCGIISITVNGIAWTCNDCLFDFWLWNFVGSISLCTCIYHKVV